MQHVFKILRQIESNSSRNTKKAILLENKTNENLRNFLLYAYSPRWIYGIGPKSIKKQPKVKKATAPQGITQRTLFPIPSVCTKSTISAYSIFDICEELKKHPYGSNKDVQLVNDFLSECDEEAYFWYSKLLLHDLKMGCSAKTINEVYTDLIDIFEVELAYPIEDHANKLSKKGPFQIQRKHNGFRFITYHYEDGTLKFFTRNGVELFDFPDIESQFKYVPTFPGGMVYDGELTDVSDKVNSIISRAMKDGSKYDCNYNIWDCLTIDEFERGKSFDKRFHRYDLLATILPAIEITPNLLLVEELYRGDDLDEIDIYYDYAKSLKWEGIMVKFDTEYVRDRTDNMLKVKGYKTEDLRVLRVEEGKEGTQNEGRLGAVVVDYNGVDVNVGGGFSKYQRALFWDNPNLIIDKVIEVRFFEPTSNKKGTHSLQHPRFKGIREDKS